MDIPTKIASIRAEIAPIQAGPDDHARADVVERLTAIIDNLLGELESGRDAKIAELALAYVEPGISVGETNRRHRALVLGIDEIIGR